MPPFLQVDNTYNLIYFEPREECEIVICLSLFCSLRSQHFVVAERRPQHFKGHIDYFQPEAVMVRCNLRPQHLKSQERSVLCSCSIVVWNLHWVTRPSMLLPLLPLLLRLLLLQHWRTSRRILNLTGDGIETIFLCPCPRPTTFATGLFKRTYRSYDNNIGDGIKCILACLHFNHFKFN